MDHMNFEHKMVLVIRRDLKLSHGKMAVQTCHAAVTCALESKKKGKYFNEWYREGQKKVVLKCDDEDHMDFLKDVARKNGLVAHIITDAGLTEVPPGTRTCLGIGPGPNALVDKVTGELSLL